MSGERPGAVWAAPGVAFFAAFAVLPMIGVGYLSLTAWNGLGNPQVIGGANFTRLSSLLAQGVAAPFWQEESYDHIVRNARALDAGRRYV